MALARAPHAAVASSAQAAVLMQWYTHAGNMTEVNWALLLGGTVITAATWQKIPAEQRPALLAAAREAARKLREQTRAGGVRDIEAMAARGVNVVRLDAATRVLWLNAAEGAYPTLRDRFVPAEAYDAALRFREEYRNQARGAGGR